MSKEEDSEKTEWTVDSDFPSSLPVLASRDVVAFPSVMMSLYLSNESGVKAVEKALKSNELILMLAHREDAGKLPVEKSLHDVGVISRVVRSIPQSDGMQKVYLQGIVRAKVSKVKELKSGSLSASVVAIKDGEENISAEDESILNRIHENLQILVEYQVLPEEILIAIDGVLSHGEFCDIIVAHYKLDVAEAQELLEAPTLAERIRATDAVVTDNLNHYLVSEKVRARTQSELTKGQEEHYLREQMRAIQKELGDEDGGNDDLQSLEKALLKAKLPPDARKEADRQLRRLQRMHQEGSEFGLIRTYLEWLSELPWNIKSRDRLDLKIAREILDEDHYGLDKVKDRILEYLSVRKLKKDSKGPILCFVGPPGVGKTSLGRSIAKAMNRKFTRMALGGMRDEAEVLGHRRTYVGALPGRIIKGLRGAGSRNPVFLLDELDKLGSDFRGDPSAALLEVLDPAQNKEFRDHYLDVPFDLSSVVFIATANVIDTIPEALLDRLELISLPGYTTREKEEIAKRHLVPRQIHEHGLEQFKISFTKEAILFLIERYTREAGVRTLEREIGSLCRKLAREYAEEGTLRKTIKKETVKEFLGATKYDAEEIEVRDLVGLARGLAWTAFGGEVLHIEASTAEGSGKLALTGQLGSVMQESAQAALFYTRSNAKSLGLPVNFHKNLDIHLHVPSGATPKDGPSAGITMVTALVSALTGRKISKKVAMTGEITLRGNVLPIGGLKEKALAALRQGMTKVIIPFDNVKDLEDIPKDQREKLKFIPVKHVSEVLEIALLREASKSKTKTKAKAKGKVKASPRVKKRTATKKR